MLPSYFLDTWHYGRQLDPNDRKILRSSYFGNGCHGDEQLHSGFTCSIYDHECGNGGSVVRCKKKKKKKKKICEPPAAMAVINMLRWQQNANNLQLMAL